MENIQQEIPRNFYRLRWKFFFTNGKLPKTGVWNGTSQLVSDSAFAINKEFMESVSIEAENLVTNEILTLVNCPKSEYASMQWEAYARMPAFFKGNGGTARENISGLSILTSDEKITAWVNGNISREQLSDHDKKFNIKEHSI